MGTASLEIRFKLPSCPLGGEWKPDYDKACVTIRFSIRVISLFLFQSCLRMRLRRPAREVGYGTTPGFRNLAGCVKGSFSFFLRIWKLFIEDSRRWRLAKFLTCSVTSYWFCRRFSVSFLESLNETGLLLSTALPWSYVDPFLTSLIRLNTSRTSLKHSCCCKSGSMFRISLVRMVLPPLPAEKRRRRRLDFLS